jgi:hypothetical protein
MQRRQFASAIVGLGALALASCFGSYERAVEETRAGLIGKTGRELRACLGVPADFDRDGDVETLTYRWFDTRNKTPVGNGGVGGVVVGQHGIGSASPSLPFPRDPEEQPFCRLEFILGKGGVTKVTAVGRDEVGLRADAECMLRARRCVDDDEDGDEDQSGDTKE